MRTQIFKVLTLFFFVALAGACVAPSDKIAETVTSTAPSVDAQRNIVTSSRDPALSIKVDLSLDYLGRHTIKIRDVASGERLIFADVQGGKAERLFILQFEGFNEGIDDAYRYDLSTSPEVAGYPWRSNAYAFNMADSIKNNPTAESASTAAFLEAQDIAYPEDWMMWRSLTVTTEDRRNELILFYIEDLAAAGASLNDLYDENGDSTEYWRGLMPDLEYRANTSFMLSEPDQANWQTIPRYFDQAK